MCCDKNQLPTITKGELSDRQQYTLGRGSVVSKYLAQKPPLFEGFEHKHNMSTLGLIALENEPFAAVKDIVIVRPSTAA